MHFLFFVDRGEFSRWTLLAEATLFFGVKTGEFWRAMTVFNFEVLSHEPRGGGNCFLQANPIPLI
jgi:hypothetical protein